MLKIELNSLEETEEFGERLGRLLGGGDIVCLEGDLGAGKTTLTQSIGKGLEVDDYITSPTFTIINEYVGRLPVYHFDVYRLESPDESFDLGFDEYFYGEGVCVIEWADKIKEVLPKEYLTLDMKVKDEKSRIIDISGKGKYYEDMIRELE